MTSRPHPDPAQGIFETMLVVRGEPVLPAAHLGRLEASLEAVYGFGLPARARQIVAERATELELGRLRLTVAPPPAENSSEPGLEVDAGELDGWPHFPEQPLSLRPHQVDGGLGCHKWADRAALPDAAAGEAPLLIDGEEVLEAAWASLFAVRNGVVFTPPLDGRILPGVTRATMVELAEARGLEVVEGAIRLADLRLADEVFLTNSIRGVEVVDSVDGTPLEAPGAVTALLRNDLRNAWNLAPAPAVSRP
ncbi:MAG TPA: aminotransferase class IV [Solirubrobacterales bacterium]|nr:aminotransferase class IV [Solirubrobacterales bacterium]